MVYHYNVRYQWYMHQDILSVRDALKASIGEVTNPSNKITMNESWQEMQYGVSVKRSGNKRSLYQGVFERFHRWLLLIEATVSNRSQMI